MSESKNVVPNAMAMPLLSVAALIAFIVIVAKLGIAAGVGFWLLINVAILLWGMQQGRRARQEIRDEIERGGCKVVKMNYRYLRLGPFSLWNSSRTQHVYRVLVQEPTGYERVVWARWGRRWYWNQDKLELRCES